MSKVQPDGCGGKGATAAPLHALVVAQAFPPLLKNAGGVAKRYLALCSALIDGLGWRVTLVTPVDVTASGEKDVDRWLQSGSLTHVPVRALKVTTDDGEACTLDILSLRNMCTFLSLMRGKCDACFTDDIPFRLVAFLLARGMGVPTVTTTHTDATRLKSYKGCAMKLAWRMHVGSAHYATVHASVSRVFADIMHSSYRVPVQAVWPPMLWSDTFRRPPCEYAERAATLRASWLSQLGVEPRAVLLYAGRWSAEKRIHLLVEALPETCALVLVGDSTSDYADHVEGLRGPNVLPLRRTLHAEELRCAYAAADLFVSASDFETLGNVVVESFCAGTPVAVQPAQGHLEFVEDGKNSYFVDFGDAEAARKRLRAIVDAGVRTGIEPALTDLGTRLRTLDFPRELEAALVAPALGATKARRRSCCRRALVEPALRSYYLTVWLILWTWVGIFTRIFYLLSCRPRFRYLPKAGGCVEADLENQHRPERQVSPSRRAKEAWAEPAEPEIR